MQKSLRLGILALAWCLVGCVGPASIPFASPELDSVAKTFQPPSGYAYLYVIRPGQYRGSAILFQVIVDGKALGGIASGTYHLFPLTPGDHVVAATSNENQVNILLTSLAGQNYFIQIIPKWGASVRVGLERVKDEAKGREMVLSTSRAQGFSHP